MNTKHMGFAPVFDKNSRVLVLGSFPSVLSRAEDFYYGNKQNRFWKTLQSLFGGDISSVQGKKQICLSNGIALWDIVQSCDIIGSLDADIKNPILVDLSVVLQQADIRAILCNGKTAYGLTCKGYHGNLPVVQLPSTSPANTRFDVTPWKKAFQQYLKEQNND